MRITELHATNVDMTDAMNAYATEKVMSLERVAQRFEPCDAAIEVGKTSEHHNKGDVFFAEINMTIPGRALRARVVTDDLYAAIDQAKDDMKRQLVDVKDKMVSDRTEA